MTRTARIQNGSALVSVLLLMALLMALLAAYFTVTTIETATTKSSMDSTRGFYAAEAGLNLRAEQIRQTFLGYNRPVGTTPASLNRCESANQGAGDFRCIQFDLRERSVMTYVTEPAGNPANLTIPRGEPYQNLNAQEYVYNLSSQTGRDAQHVEAVLEMGVKSRLVPMFQFAAFYNKDLEILPGPAMQLEGPVHSNGDLYLDAGASLDISGQVTTAGDLYRGRKNADSCNGNPVSVIDPGALAELPACGGSRELIQEADVTGWNGMIRMHLDPVTVPGPEVMDPTPGQIYWDEADLRVMLDLNGVPSVQVRNPDGSIDAAGTANLQACGAVSYGNSFYNNREGAAIDMLDVDLQTLLDCAHTRSLLMGGRMLDDTTQGGLVFYLGVDGPDMDTVNTYGTRVRQGAEIAATVGGAPAVRGLTVVTNQAVYVEGDYNAVRKKPAAFLADSLNVLSNNWDDINSNQDLGQRLATSTTINAAFLAGTDVTGSAEGAAGQDAGEYNGGLENYPRFHERWSNRTLRYRGSFVSLNEPRHVSGDWVYGNPQYEAPIRDWRYDTDFDDASNLPPLSPRFVYLRQELFMRHFHL